MRSFRHWTPRYFYNRLMVFIYEIKHPTHPWLTKQANAILSSWLRKTDVGLEWGSGRSTLWFAGRVASLTSVECNPIWFEKVKNVLANGNITNVDIYLCDIPKNPKEIGASPYVRIADSFSDNSLDFVLVDGPGRADRTLRKVARSTCALRVLKKIKPGGIIIIDNINWFLPSTSKAPNSRTEKDRPLSQSWTLLIQHLKDWRCIWTSNGISDTAIWIKPPYLYR